MYLIIHLWFILWEINIILALIEKNARNADCVVFFNMAQNQ